MLEEVLAPVSGALLENLRSQSETTLVHQVLFHEELSGIPDLSAVKVALIGVLEDRGSVRNKGAALASDAIRQELYNLQSGNWPSGIADMGNIFQGETVNDTYFALQEVAVQLLQRGIILVILGGSQDLTYPNYRAYDRLEQMVNLVSIDKEFDLGRHLDQLTGDNYLSHIVLNQPYNLFNFANIGYQTFFVHQDELDLMERMYFETHRLGALKADFKEFEPIVRDADIISFDISSVKFSENPGVNKGVPNGFDGMEACALARYSGLSDKVSSFGIYNYNPSLDTFNQTSQLIAQMLWYFVEGVFNRKGDYPFSSKKVYTKFTVLIEDGSLEMVFYKSPKSNRWWIEVPGNNISEARNRLIPCSYEDYLQACDQHIPNRWWKARQRGL